MKNINDFAKAVFGKTPDELAATERLVLEHAANRLPLSSDINAELDAGDGFGEKLADGIARVGGSWGFIIGFVIFLVVWATANTILLTRDAFDPYPFIFLNLLLSMIAALQAPVIMMSQNRQSERDRYAAQKDYEVNLKAEIELLALHHKFDRLLAEDVKELRDEVMRLSGLITAAQQNAGQNT
ncbi:DUF1003 domain-containing protein [Pararhizobium sp.]|uniref:DUF1003 domain-containing protein n=1 Tax=Pararhizobium sp. TaxID=1977563 RepID=UPI0027217EFD|nr:DUF1003 domain-containing protein [Pararhizobium sp.]MDO9418942.1 DUF1003 domain-containing protein [Pararhizobium sp.]